MLYRKNKTRKTKLAHLLAVWFIAILCFGALVIGQQDPAAPAPAVLDKPEPAPADQPRTGENGEAVILTQDASGQTIQTLSFKKDMTITDALRFLSLKYQKNIVPTSRVNGMITVTNLYNVTFEEALQAILGTSKFEVQGNFIMVYTPEEYDQIKADKRRRECQVFTLSYLSAEEAKKMVTPLLSPDGSVGTSSPAKVGVPGGQSISSESGGDNLAYQDTVVVQDYPENIAEVKSLLDQLDNRPKQVLIEATILAATLTEGMEMGVDLNLADGTALTGVTAQQDYVTGDTVSRGREATSPIDQIANWAGNGTPIESAGFAAVGGNGLRIGISIQSFSAFITALEETTDVTILANPKILAVNKQLGQVYIGTKLGYREGNRVSDGGTLEEGTVKFLDTGTTLAFRPYIGDEGYIRMDIHPKDTTGNLNAQGVPNEMGAEVKTNVIVKDGQTVVIGGLFRDVVNTSRSQIPLLGDIPGLGYLFRGTSDEVQRQEVIVLLTPHIIDEPDQLPNDARIADAQRKAAYAKDRLHKLSVSRMAEDAYAQAADLYTKGDNAGALDQLCWALHLRPTYLEALRLRERIVQAQAGGPEVIERIMIDAIEQEEETKWLRY